MYAMYNDHAHFQKPKISNGKFTILHYAAPVTYTVNGFMQKNQDALQQELVNLFSNSTCDVVSSMFSPKGAEENNERNIISVKGPLLRRGSSTLAISIGLQFKQQLGILMENIKVLVNSITFPLVFVLPSLNIIF